MGCLIIITKAHSRARKGSIKSKTSRVVMVRVQEGVGGRATKGSRRVMEGNRGSKGSDAVKSEEEALYYADAAVVVHLMIRGKTCADGKLRLSLLM